MAGAAAPFAAELAPAAPKMWSLRDFTEEHVLDSISQRQASHTWWKAGSDQKGRVAHLARATRRLVLGEAFPNRKWEEDYLESKSRALLRVKKMAACTMTIFLIFWSAFVVGGTEGYARTFGLDRRAVWRSQAWAIWDICRLNVAHLFMWLMVATYRFKPRLAARHGETWHVLFGCSRRSNPGPRQQEATAQV